LPDILKKTNHTKGSGGAIMLTMKKRIFSVKKVTEKLKLTTAFVLAFLLLFGTIPPIQISAATTGGDAVLPEAVLNSIEDNITEPVIGVLDSQTYDFHTLDVGNVNITEALLDASDSQSFGSQPLDFQSQDFQSQFSFPVIQTGMSGREANALTPVGPNSALVAQIRAIIDSPNKPRVLQVGSTTVRLEFDEWFPGFGDMWVTVNGVNWPHPFINTNTNTLAFTTLFLFENLEGEIWIGFAAAYGYGNIRFVGVGNAPVAHNMPSVIYVGFDPGGEMYGAIPQYISDPVDIINGNLIWDNTDIALHGAQPLFFTRYYNSQYMFYSTLGVGWRHNYEYYMFVENGQPVIEIPNGFEYRFSNIGGQWQAAVPYVAFRIGANNTFIFTAHDGTTITFNNFGLTESITDIYGNTTHLTHDVVNGRARLATVTNRSGSLVFEYETYPNGLSRIKSVTTVPAGGNGASRTVSYNYNNYALTGFTNVDNDTQTYTYDGNFNLTTVTNFEGVVNLTNTFDNRNRVTTQRMAGQNLSYFFYDHFRRVNTFINPDGWVTEYHYGANYKITRTEEYQQGTSDTERVTRSQSIVNGLLISSTDYMGNTTTYGYDNQGNRTSVIYPDQTVQTWEYNARRQITSAVYRDENGNILENITFEYDTPAGGNLRRIIFAVPGEPNHVREFRYNAQNDLVTYIDANGNETTFTHDARGNVLSVTDPTGYTTEYTYDVHGRLETETAPMRGINAPRNITTYVYSDAGSLLSIIYPDNTIQTSFDVNNNGFNREIIDPMGNITGIEYTTMSRPSSVTDSRSGIVSYGYDTSGRLTRVTDPENGLTANQLSTIYGYDSRGRVTSQTEPNQNQANLVSPATPAIWQFSYNDNNDLTLILTPENGRTDIDYNNMGFITSIARQRNTTETAIIEFAYDRLGNVTLITDPMENTQELAYDRYGNITRVTDANGHEWEYIYDNESNLIRIIDPLNGIGKPTIFEYDDAGRLEKIITPANATYIYEYNANALLYRVTEVTEPQNRTWENSYDNMSRLTRQTNPDGTYSEFVYDNNGQLLRVIDENNNVVSYTYDANGNVVTITDANNNAKPESEREITHFEYDLNNRLTEVTRRLLDDTILHTYASYTYDNNGNLRSVESNGNRSEWDYDAMNRPIRERIAGNGERTFEYNDAGELTELTNGRGTLLSFEYDLNGQMTHGAGISYTYDAVGNIETVTNAAGQTVREYDELNRITEYTDVNDNIIGYTYDADGRIKTITYPGGRVVSYDYNRAGQLIRVTDYSDRVTSYTYNGNGQLETTTRPDGSVETLVYDDAGRITRKTTVNAGVIINDYSYEYDNNGDFTSETNSTDITDTLTDAHIRMIFGAGTMTYGAGNQLETYNAQPVVFDADGNMTFGPLGNQLTAYVYDDLNQLTSVGGTTYVYDGEGNRVSQTVNGQATTYVTNPNAELSQLLITNHPDGSQTFYVYGIGLISQERIGTGNETEYRIFHYDYRGSTTALTNLQGTVTDRWAYLPFGEVIGREGTTETIFQFVGRWGVQTDCNSLHYMRARYYNPTIKRFINEDFHWNIHNMQYGDNPVHVSGLYASAFARIPHMPSIIQSTNRYTYAMNKPHMFIDPTGLAIDTVTDFMSTTWSLRTLIRKPSWANAGYLTLDVVCMVLPFIPSPSSLMRASRAARVIDNATDVTRVTRVANNATDLTRTIRTLDNTTDVAGGARRITQRPGGTPTTRNPYGRSGGPAHRNRVSEIMTDIDSRGLRVETEYRFPTSGGPRNARYADVVGIRNGQVVEIHQVGRVNSSGFPVRRESEAIRDIMRSSERQGAAIIFHPYN
jgi:RHS repeat-associated protein